MSKFEQALLALYLAAMATVAGVTLAVIGAPRECEAAPAPRANPPTLAAPPRHIVVALPAAKHDDSRLVVELIPAALVVRLAIKF